MLLVENTNLSAYAFRTLMVRFTIYHISFFYSWQFACRNRHFVIRLFEYVPTPYSAYERYSKMLPDLSEGAISELHTISFPNVVICKVLNKVS
jgi:hypothetical protein